VSPKQILGVIVAAIEKLGGDEPKHRQDLYLLFKWLFQEMLINLNLLRNNELVKYLNQRIILKHPVLLSYIADQLKVEEDNLDVLSKDPKFLEDAV